MASQSVAVPAPPPIPAATKADEIDFKVFGTEMQFVEVELDPGESALAEAGGFMDKLLGGFLDGDND